MEHAEEWGLKLAQLGVKNYLWYPGKNRETPPKTPEGLTSVTLATPTEQILYYKNIDADDLQLLTTVGTRLKPFSRALGRVLGYLYPGYINTQEAKDGAWIWWKIAEGKVPTILWGESILRDFNRQEVEKGLAQLRAATKAEISFEIESGPFQFGTPY